MKKVLLVLLTSLLVLLNGCAADGQAEISKRDDVVISIDDKNSYNLGNYYDALVTNNAENMIISHLVDMVYAQAINKDDSEIVTEVDSDVESLKQTYGDSVDMLLYYMGYSTLEQYRNTTLLSAKLSKVAELYIQDNMDSLIEKSHTVKAKIMDVTDVETANTVIERLKNGEQMSDLAVEYESVSYNGEEAIYFEGYTEMAECITLTFADAKVGLLEAPVSNDTYYYIIEFVDVNPNNFKDELSDAWLMNGLVDGMEVLGTYTKKYDFKIYDEDIDKKLRTNYPELFN